MKIGVIDVEVDPSGLDYVTSDGRRYADVLLTLDDDAHIRLRTGYQCVHCLEVFWSAWPDSCRMCGFPVGSVQREMVEQYYQGEVKLPPRGLTADELARGEEEFLRKLKEAEALMATSAQWFGQAGGYLIARLWLTQQMGVILMANTYVPNRDTQMRYSDVSGSELASAGGYTAGGKEITNRTTSYNAAADEYDMLGDDVQWGPGVTFTPRYGIVYEMATADKLLWELLDFGQDVAVVNGYFVTDFIAGVLATKAAAAV